MTFGPGRAGLGLGQNNGLWAVLTGSGCMPKYTGGRFVRDLVPILKGTVKSNSNGIKRIAECFWID